MRRRWVVALAITLTFMAIQQSPDGISMRESTAIAREVANEKGLQGDPASVQALAMDYGRLAILRGHAASPLT